MSRPVATTGTATGTVPTQSSAAAPSPVVPMAGSAEPTGQAPVSTPKKNTPAPSSYKNTPESTKTTGSAASTAADDKKKKRTSFFGKIKEKFKS